MKNIQQFKIRALAAITLSASLILVGCGGSGAGSVGATADVTPPTSSSSSSSSSSTSSTSSSGAAATSKLALLAGGSVLASDGKTPVDLTAIVTSAANVSETGRTVVFSVEDSVATSGVRLQVETSTTDASGVAKAKLYLLSDSTERTIKVIAKSGDAPISEVLIKVAGNTIGLNGAQQLPLNGAPSTYTVLLKDSSGTAIANKPVAISSAKGNTLSGATGTTDQSGQVQFTLRGVNGGDDTIQVSALGVTAIKNVKVSTESLTVTPAQLVIPINTDGVVAISYSASPSIPAGTVASLSTTQGTVSLPSTSITTGAASFTVRSGSAGPATITVRVAGNESTANVNFVSVTPSAISLQTSPAVIGPNLAGTSDQRTQLIAQVSDSVGNPVANQRITFAATANPSGGIIQPGVATTDFAGRATVTYIAGANTSPNNGVQFTASVSDTPLTASTTLSVSQQQLFVRIGTNNKVEDVSPVFYGLRYGVIVTDSTGNPINGAKIQAKVKPVSYQTGNWVAVTNPADGSKAWFRNVTDTKPSEDTNGDGKCTFELDKNSDGILTPGNVAVVSGALVSDANGRTELLVSYPRSYGTWVVVELEVSVTVGGTEGRAQDRFQLVISASDVSDISVPPPGANSPLNAPSPPRARCI
jgi:Bacterial Ig-like domain (group 1)